MSTFDVAVVGTGSDPDDPGNDGFAMAYHHAAAYDALADCELVACADIVEANATAFAARHDIPERAVFTDHETMVRESEPDIVSVCVPPGAHAEVVIECIQAGSPAAVHCEKPMALTWGGAQSMAQAAWRHDVQLTFNHQRRFKPSWVAARDRIEAGTIGDLERVELAPPNLYDWGTHAIDFATGVVGDVPAEWAIGQIDYREVQTYFGAHNENQAYGLWRYENGVDGVISTGAGASLVSALARFVGDAGVLELDPTDEDVPIRHRSQGDREWSREAIEDGDWTDPITDAITHVVDCLDTGAEPTLSARRALTSTEIIFGIWESARRRGRVEFPLDIDDNPLEAMVASGALTPESVDEDGT